MCYVLKFYRNCIVEAVNDLQELINDINEVNFSKCKQEKVQRIQGQKSEESFLSLHSFTLHRCCFTP